MSISSIKSSQSAQYARAARNTSASRSTGNSSAAQSAAARASRNTGSSSYNTRANQTVSQPNTSSANRDSFTSGSYVGSSKKASPSASKTSASTKRDGFISGNSGANTNQVKKTSTNTNRSDSVYINKTKYASKSNEEIEDVLNGDQLDIYVKTVFKLLSDVLSGKKLSESVDNLKKTTTYLPSDNKDDVIVRGLEFNSQKKSNWCWAATMQTLLNYKGNNMSQEDVVKLITGNTSNEKMAADAIVESLQKNDSYRNYVSSGGLKYNEIIKKIDSGEPVIFTGENMDSSLVRKPHAIICYGYNNSNPNKNELFVFDPSKGMGKITITHTEKNLHCYEYSYTVIGENGDEENYKYRIMNTIYYDENNI